MMFITRKYSTCRLRLKAFALMGSRKAWSEARFNNLDFVNLCGRSSQSSQRVNKLSGVVCNQPIGGSPAVPDVFGKIEIGITNWLIEIRHATARKREVLSRVMREN